MTNPYKPMRKAELTYPKEFSEVSLAEPDTGLPEGSISEILDWVDNDPESASIALKHEKKNKKRKTLMKDLQAILEEAVGVNGN